MNPFLQLLKGYGTKAAPRVFQGAIDTVTDPRTYQRLAKDAEKLLGRNLPPQFAGANFGSIPTRATGLINDLVETSGVQRAVQGGMTSRAIQEMAGIAPRLARTATQTAEGLLRAPSIGQGLTRQITTRLPEAAQALDPFARDYGLTRELMKRAGGGMQDVAKSLLPKQAFNPVGGVGGLIQNLNKVTSPLLQSSSIAKNIPGIGSLPGFARNMLIPASPAGVAFAVAGLEGSSPQGFDNWSHLGYRSKEDMQNRVNAQIIKEENAKNVAGAGRYVPGEQQKFIPSPGNQNRNAQVPPAPQLPPPSTNPVADRAYAAERSSVAQQAAQNPMLQQYQNLRATNPAAAQNLGMQAWAQQYGGPEGLASQVKPGQVGYDVIQQALAGQTASSTSKVPGVVSQPWAEGVVSVGGATRAGLPMTPEEEAQLQYQMFNYRPE